MFQNIIEQKRYSGARDAFSYALCLFQTQKNKYKDWTIYVEAELRLLSSDMYYAECALRGDEIMFRNHQRDKKGKLVSVEAYIVEGR